VVGKDTWLQEAIADNSLMAVTDGSYIKEQWPDLCSASFILECTKGRGRLIGDFADHNEDACAYRGELLGLLAIHLILLAINKVHPHLTGTASIYSDCLGAIGTVATLPQSNIPARCRHSDILKIIMLHCRELSFTCSYAHVRAHQDDKLDYAQLERPAQLNVIVDFGAKLELERIYCWHTKSAATGICGCVCWSTEIDIWIKQVLALLGTPSTGTKTFLYIKGDHASTVSRSKLALRL